ncbi:MAG: 50S ribosomal protein L24 [Minisyncoccia bacterium]
MPKQVYSRQVYKIRLKKGDLVMVRSGKYKGKTGKVTALHPSFNKVTVEGINVVKKNIKPNRLNPKGRTVEITKPMWVSKVGIVETSGKKPGRIGYKVAKDGSKMRINKLTRKEIK